MSRSGTAYKEHSDNWTLVGRHFMCASKVEVNFSKSGKMNRQKKIGRIHPQKKTVKVRISYTFAISTV
jgi:hypothetical protein